MTILLRRSATFVAGTLSPKAACKASSGEVEHVHMKVPQSTPTTQWLSGLAVALSPHPQHWRLLDYSVVDFPTTPCSPSATLQRSLRCPLCCGTILLAHAIGKVGGGGAIVQVGCVFVKSNLWLVDHGSPSHPPKKFRKKWERSEHSRISVSLWMDERDFHFSVSVLHIMPRLQIIEPHTCRTDTLQTSPRTTLRQPNWDHKKPALPLCLSHQTAARSLG
jgi:hypothetical protein